MQNYDAYQLDSSLENGTHLEKSIDAIKCKERIFCQIVGENALNQVYYAHKSD